MQTFLEFVENKSIPKEIIKICKYFKDKLGPDYQNCYWHPKTKEVWYVSFDGDEPKITKELVKKLEKIKGVKKVRCEAEWTPKTEEGWVKIYSRNS